MCVSVVVVLVVLVEEQIETSSKEGWMDRWVGGGMEGWTMLLGGVSSTR